MKAIICSIICCFVIAVHGAELKQSTAKNKIVFMVDSADHISGKTGLTLTITASKDGAAFASISPTVTELANGWYSVALTTTHTNTLGALALHVSATGADPTDTLDEVIAWDKSIVSIPAIAAGSSGGLATVSGSGSIGLSSGRVNADVLYWNAAALASPDTAGYPKVTIKNGTGAGELATAGGETQANVTSVSSSGTAASYLAALANAHHGATLDVRDVTRHVATVTNPVSLSGTTITDIATGVWQDANPTDFQTAASAGLTLISGMKDLQQRR